MIPGSPFNPATETSRRPTPEAFAHLRRWVDPVENFIELMSVLDMTNIDQQIDQISKFFISSIIQRTISQTVAAYNGGFVTLQATEAGELKVKLAGATQPITSVKIDFAGGGDETLVAGQAGKKIKVTSMSFTVAGETNITMKAGGTAITGPMDFGGTNEPRGMVISHGYVPYEIAAGSALVINSSAAVQVSGYITGFIE